MAKVKHLTVSLENQPGRLAAVAKALADAKVNIVAVLGRTADDKGSVQVVVDNPAKAKKALSAAGFTYVEGTLDQVELPNKPGALAEYAAKLAKKGINIDAAVWLGTQRSEEIGAVFLHLKKGRGLAERSVKDATV